MDRNTEFYEDFYGFTASIRTKPGHCLLTVRMPNGTLYHRRTYNTYRGARVALGKLSEGTARIKSKREENLL